MRRGACTAKVSSKEGPTARSPTRSVVRSPPRATRELPSPVEERGEEADQRGELSESLQEDRLLIERARKGDASALHRLVRKHQDRAYGYAFRLTRNPEEAGDIVAEAFVRVHNAVRNFKGNSAFTTWLYRIITNCYLDHRKKERTRQAL
ncbi:sigma-70 family RNA polymerase sigma factor, partial [bacterium]